MTANPSKIEIIRMFKSEAGLQVHSSLGILWEGEAARTPIKTPQDIIGSLYHSK
jgi:hypothetical protein